MVANATNRRQRSGCQAGTALQRPAQQWLVLILPLLALMLVGLAASPPAGASLPAAPPNAPAAAPDLIIASITLTPPNPGAGGTADIEVVVKNQGDAAVTVGFNLFLYAEPAEEPPTQSTAYTIFAGYALTLPPGGSFKYTLPGQLFMHTPPKVYAWVDPPWENKVAEANENNNLFPPVAAGGDAYEDDDTCATAKAITTDGALQDHNLYRDPDADSDWLKFNGAGGVTYLAEATAVGADAKLVLELKSSCDGPASFGNGAKIEFTAPADGPVYVKVSHVQSEYGVDNAYQFKVTSDSGCTNAFEPNNACTLAGDLPLDTTQTHTFCKAGDADWTRFAVTAGTQYKVIASNVGPHAKAKVSLYMNCSDVNSTASGQSFEFTAAAAGHVYVKAEQLDSTVQGAGTEYTMRAERVGQEGCSEDSFEQDDNAADAKPIGSDSSAQTHNICPAADGDWVKFSATSGITYNLETFNLASTADTVLCLHAANGDQLACDDDSGAGQGSRLIFAPPISGDYLLHIKDRSPSVAGAATAYDLRVAQRFCQPDALENDDALDLAKLVTPNNTVTAHNFCPGGDTDWLVFTAAAGTAYLLESTDLGPEADTVIELYDANGVLLAQNDDHTPGASSQVVFTPAKSGNYFARVRQYNPAYFGQGAEYGIRLRLGSPTPTPTVTSTPTPTPTPTPNPSGVRTLLLVNRALLAQLYDDTAATQVMSKLNDLAQHTQVRGEIIRLDNNTEVSAAYAAWLADLSNVEKANQVTTAIRNVVMTYLQQRSGVEYLLLIGDDRALPMRRILDTTPRFSESSYKHTDAGNPTGAALKNNYFLSDDYFADREPTLNQGRELFIPDLAVGRLIETPSEMIGQIDAFLAAPVTTVGNVLVSGYDFVQDVGTEDCTDWQTDFTTAQVDCSLIGEAWTGQSFRSLQLRTAAPFTVQSISGHATHYAEGAPVGNAIQAQEIINATLNLSGGLLYTPGCHAGLNVPPTNADNPLDLAQAFAGKRANYIGNTGYGWGMRNAIGLSEKLIRLYTRALLQGTKASMGKALTTAKTLYFQQDTDFSAYDEKVMQQLVFYGLPMYELASGGALPGPENPFPGVNFTPVLPTGALGERAVVTGVVTIDFRQAQNLALAETADGAYYQLNGAIHTVPDQPVQPLHFGDVTVLGLPARAVLLLNATFQSEPAFDPVITVPYNEYDTGNLEPALPNALGLYPPVPVALQQTNARASLVTQLGQYDAARQELRLFQDLQAEIYYSTDADQLAPEATVIDGITRAGSNRVEVKVGAVDTSGIKRAVVSYIQDINQSVSQLKSLDLSYDSAAQKWFGSFAGNTNSRYLVQVVDNAGNITTATNKGQYYKPGQVEAAQSGLCAGVCTFLPWIAR